MKEVVDVLLLGSASVADVDARHSCCCLLLGERARGRQHSTTMARVAAQQQCAVERLLLRQMIPGIPEPRRTPAGVAAVALGLLGWSECFRRLPQHLICCCCQLLARFDV